MNRINRSTSGPSSSIFGQYRFILPNSQSPLPKNKLDSLKIAENNIYKCIPCGSKDNAIDVLNFLTLKDQNERLLLRNESSIFSLFYIPSHPDRIFIEFQNCKESLAAIQKLSKTIFDKYNITIEDISFVRMIKIFGDFTFCSALFSTNPPLVRLFSSALPITYRGDAARVTDVDLENGRVKVLFLPRINYQESYTSSNYSSPSPSPFQFDEVDQNKLIPTILSLKFESNEEDEVFGYKYYDDYYTEDGLRLATFPISSIPTRFDISMKFTQK